MKMNATLTHIKVPLSQLKITTNVRQDFDEAEIAELAQSIRDNGLINAITVKPPVIDEHGDKTYEVIAGGRRIRAHQWLCEHGDDFSMIDCKISTGDMWTIQMVENIQRTDLSPREKEAAIIRAIESGMSQKEISEKLSKPLSYISDIMAGIKVRQAADKAGINTDSISSKALAQFRSFDEKELPEKLRELVESGGRVSDATNILKASRTTLESSFKVGDYVKNPGRRLFWKDLFSKDFTSGSQIICCQSTESYEYFRVCKIERISLEPASSGTFRPGFIEFDDGDVEKHPSVGYSTLNNLEIDGDDYISWIYTFGPNTVIQPEGEFVENKNESTIEPTKLSEKDFYDNEKQKKEWRFSPGTQIDKIGKRLFFKDLWPSRAFVRIIDGKKIVCQITSEIKEYTTKIDVYWWTNERDSKGHNIMKKTTLEDFLIDSDEINKHWWIYEIPDNAVAINLVNFDPISKASGVCETKQKGFANPVSKEIQKRWVVFCRDKKIPESEKTAFKFYQELTTYFENTRKD